MIIAKTAGATSRLGFGELIGAELIELFCCAQHARANSHDKETA